MILSESSSKAFSQSVITFSTPAMAALSRPNFSCIFSSRSNSFKANHFFSASEKFPGTLFEISAIAFSTRSSNLCFASMIFLPLAISTILSETSEMPWFFNAEISTIGQPNSFESTSVLITSPFLLTKSIMLMAMTTGIPNSTNCVVRYRLRSKFEPSMMFRIASGFSSIRKFLATTSSNV